MTEIKLNLGSGYRPRPGFINIDCREVCSPDILCDVIEGLPFDDDSVDYVLATDFFEHIPIGKTVAVVEEIYRVLKPGGVLEHSTPSTDGRGAFCDPTHVSFWNAASWLYFTNDEHRKLYGIKAKFRGESRDVLTNEMWDIIHTHGVLTAVKDDEGYADPLVEGKIRHKDAVEYSNEDVKCPVCAGADVHDETELGDAGQAYICGACGATWGVKP